MRLWAHLYIPPRPSNVLHVSRVRAVLVGNPIMATEARYLILYLSDHLQPLQPVSPPERDTSPARVCPFRRHHMRLHPIVEANILECTFATQNPVTDVIQKIPFGRAYRSSLATHIRHRLASAQV